MNDRFGSSIHFILLRESYFDLLYQSIFGENNE